ncbi:uncharacterized protein LOC121259571 [Juglans microcarpa x Juglans regia]|uniref:uncharacterized protein LOC121259571 n=1 Tax=Juglans microcarpa x Juglans regia TaxID=2249226 RepID=UPI001B7ED7FC|nr:uncharacterized protein LOC121259571 [Juglans microcarpa x Juglans regia]
MASSTTDPPPSSSPYLLHPSDSPSLVLVSGLLTGDNFPKWQRAIRRALNAKHKLSFVDGTLNAPAKTSPDYAQWSRTKDMVLTWLLNTITPSLANSLDYHDDPRDVWLDLESRFSHGNNARLFHLKREISNLHQNQLSIPDYYNSIKQLWDELGNLQPLTDATTLEKRAEDERVFQFLLGFNDSYAALRSQILATDPLPSLNKIFSILFQEEQQRLLQVSRLHPENIALAARSSPHPRPPLKCTECGKDGHLRNRCWRVIGYPPGREPRNPQRPSLLGKPPSATVHLAASNPVPVGPSSSPIPGLSSETYQQLMNQLAKLMFNML